MGSYADDSKWADIVPIPQDDGGPNALATIAYPDAYSEATSYLRAIMAKNEFSDRVLELTADIIDMNPAHYTVWLYRAKTLLQLNKDLREELDWVNPIALAHQKNYQIWHHRQLLTDKRNAYDGEREFIGEMLDEDSKNYHVWSYRQWLVRRFDLWDDKEIPFVEEMLKRDIRNNSAWNHRWFTVFGRYRPLTDIKHTEQSKQAASFAPLSQTGRTIESYPDSLIDREVAFAQEAIKLAPQNQSPWNYLSGVLREAGRPLATVKPFVEQFANLDEPEKVRSSHALDFLASIYAGEQPTSGPSSADESQKDVKKACQALDLLAEKYDPIRRFYWGWRKDIITKEARATGTA
ncbi:farnesyltransferas-like protein [Xylona heveae TC161]|uniref:Protein farnesyltransferase/geranylgeranyltransferase type-1 subunit alpha n=1 Tax=Xylona heveae (strain CBS 132557 / TC161) TaxID=1328760 RepID=A0A165I9S3_XYLHT|nr:farnesyltransferas-like protein [Xylona heveae TC161]KZF24593.1 farnesyltransferas-like protein [Xylona heveae TC161]